MKPLSRQPRSRRAFSLIEAIAVMVVLAIIAVASSQVILNASNGYAAGTAEAQLHAELNAAMERIVTELRLARVEPSSSPVAPDVTSVTASSIQWVVAGGESRTIALSGSDLQLTTGTASQTALAKSITTFSVQAYDQSNTALAATLSGTACDAIRRFSITLTATRYGVAETIRTKVFLRAMGVGAASS